MSTKIKAKKLKPRAPVAAVPPLPVGITPPSFTPEQRKRLQELTKEGTPIADPFTQTMVNELRQTIADHARILQQMQQLDQSMNNARDRATKLEGQIDGYAMAITRWEEQHERIPSKPGIPGVSAAP
jgi:hypothetical protein